MIRLTLNPDTQPRTLTFHQETIVIGTGGDVSLPEENLKIIHVKISEQDGHFIVINVANDPFVTLNRLPFGKKKISNNDRLHIGRTVVMFEGKPSGMGTGTRTDREMGNDDLAALFREVDELEGFGNEETQEETIPQFPEEDESPHEVFIAKKPPSVPVMTPAVVEVDDDNDGPIGGYEHKEKEPEPRLESNNIWPFLFSFFFAIMAIVTIVAGIIYVSISDKSDVERTLASEGVADVSMALTYAQVNHISPHKQNWFDPDFLKNNLASVLSTEYPSFANIDNQGQFSKSPYFLRIYTSSDLSHFIVIAQPEPSLLQWLIPKAAIIVDSKTMQLRSVLDIKALNRLLANPTGLDTSDATEISRLIKQGQLIPLADLPAKKGFIPPKALALLRPGAENLIYNAPRYYHFGESLMKKAVSILQIVGSTHEVARLQQQLGELSKFPDLVLYSSQGMQKAIQSQKALATLMPDAQFLTAYLNLDANGIISSSHLLFNDDYPEFFTTSKLTSPNDLRSALFVASGAKIESPPVNLTAMSSPITPATAHPFTEMDEVIDYHHPLFLQLHALSTDRQRALKAISDRMISLLHNQNEGTATAFSENFSKLLRWYEQVDRQHQDKIAKELITLYREYADMPLAKFAAYIKAAGLALIAQESLAARAQEMGRAQMSTEQVQEQLAKIQAAKDFADLDKIVTETAGLLNLAQIPDADKLIAYQNELHTQTILQLKRFMLSPTTRLPSDAFTAENRNLVCHILKTSWVTDDDECEFYLSEFDLIKN